MPVAVILATVIAIVCIGVLLARRAHAYYVPRALARRVMAAAEQATGSQALAAAVALALGDDASRTRLAREATTTFAAPVAGVEDQSSPEGLDAMLDQLAGAADMWASFIPAESGGDTETIGGGQALRERLAQAKTAGKRKPIATARALERARDSLADLLEPFDPHHADRAALTGRLSGLGLLAADTEIVDLSQYQACLRAYDTTLAEALAETLSGLHVQLDRTRSTISRAVSVPMSIERQGDELRSLARDLSDATGRYLDQIELALSVTNSEPSFIAAARGLLREADGRLAGDEQLGALASLGDVAVPLLEGWQPSEEYRGTLSATVAAVHKLIDRQLLELASWVSEMSDVLAREGSGMADTVLAAADACRARREEAWESLLIAGEEVIVQAAVALAQAAGDGDASLPVQAATTLFLVEDLAAARLAAAASDLIPAPSNGGAPDGADGEDEADTLLRKLHENSLVWAAANVPILAVLDSKAVDGGALAHPLAPLAGVPEHLLKAHADMCSYVHTHFASNLGQACHELLGSVKTNILPHVSGVAAPHQALLEQGSHHLAASFSNVLPTWDTMGGELLRADGDLPLALGHYLEANAAHAGEAFLRFAKATPQVHDAIEQVGTAAHLTGTAVLHAMAGHIPVVTVALSVSREIKLRQEREMELAQSVRNVLIDAGGVAAGLGTAALGGAAIGLHGLWAAPVTVPGAMAGMVLVKIYKQRRFVNAMKKYEQQRIQFELMTGRIQVGYSNEIRTAIAKERTALTRELCVPEPLEQRAGEELRRLVQELRGALLLYTAKAHQLAEAARGAQVARATVGLPLDDLERRLAVGQEALATAHRELEHGRLAAALMRLGEAAPPVCAWSASHEYERSCGSVAERIAALGESHRTEIGQWLEKTSRDVESHKAALEDAIKSAIETRMERLAQAAVPLEAARAHAEVHAPLVAA